MSSALGFDALELLEEFEIERGRLHAHLQQRIEHMRTVRTRHNPDYRSAVSRLKAEGQARPRQWR